MTMTKEPKAFEIMNMSKYPIYTRQLRRYGELIADVEIRIQPYLKSDKLNIVILEPITE